jgi:hypothetical protein
MVAEKRYMCVAVARSMRAARPMRVLSKSWSDVSAFSMRAMISASWASASVSIGSQVFGHRQSTQGHQAVGFQLQQALRDAAYAQLGRVGWRDDQQALEAAGTQAKVGHHAGATDAQQRGHGLAPFDPRFPHGSHASDVIDITVNHRHHDGGHRATWNACQPRGCHHQGLDQRVIVAVNEGVVGQGLHDGVARELGVALPLERVTVGKAQALEVARRCSRVRSCCSGSWRRCATPLARDAFVDTATYTTSAGRRMRAGWPGMDLVVQHAPLRVIRRQNPQRRRGRLGGVGHSGGQDRGHGKT